MSRFDDYFLLDENSVVDYVREKLDIFDEGEPLFSNEIGDGNLNYVFRVKSGTTDKSVIVSAA